MGPVRVYRSRAQTPKHRGRTKLVSLEERESDLEEKKRSHHVIMKREKDKIIRINLDHTN